MAPQEADFPPVGEAFQQLVGGWITGPSTFLDFTKEPDRFLKQLPREQAAALIQGLLGLAESNVAPGATVNEKVKILLQFAGDYLAAQKTESSDVAKVTVDDLLFSLGQE